MDDLQVPAYPHVIQQAHYPDSLEDGQKAMRRIVCDKLLQVQVSSLVNKYRYQQ
ncbi:MAG: hypothetical protein WCJ81_06835 [bacterium]